MRIGMILERDFPTTPPDIRVEKEIRSLLHAGHEVDLLSLKITSTLDFEQINGLNIMRVPIPMLCIRDWEPERVSQHFQSKQSPWVAAVKNFIKKRYIDVLHVHDLPLVWTTTYATSDYNIPVIFDMHEVYPPMVEFLRAQTGRAWQPAQWASRYEKDCLDRVDKIVVVVEESRQRLIQMGISADKVSVIMNTEKPENMASFDHNGQLPKDLQDKFLVTYVGTFGEIRGLEDLIRAAKKISSEIPIHLLLVGGNYNQPQLETLSQQLGIQDKMTITGWVNFTEIPKFIAMSDVCVAPHVKNAFTDATIPHKLFHYMLMAKPVVVSNADPLKRIVKECDCGVVFSSGNVNELANALLHLAYSEEERQRLGANGRNAALIKYSWRREEITLLNLYDNLFKDNRRVNNYGFVRRHAKYV